MEMDTILPEKDPLGTMLKDYLNGGDPDTHLVVESPVLDMSKMYAGTLFRSLDEMSDLEKQALDLCRGRVLDVGGGSGCHSLVLQERGMDVIAMDISPGCVAVMEKRGVNQVVHSSLFDLQKNFSDQPFDTLLMLMNGIGICGSIEGLNYFFQYISPFLNQGGQILADSTDIASLYTSAPLCPGLGTGDEDPEYYGETQFVMSYKHMEGEVFDWLYIDFSTLAFYAKFHGWSCECVKKEGDGKYLARIY